MLNVPIRYEAIIIIIYYVFFTILKFYHHEIVKMQWNAIENFKQGGSDFYKYM